MTGLQPGWWREDEMMPDESRKEMGLLETLCRGRDWRSLRPDEESFLRDVARAVDEISAHLHRPDRQVQALSERVALLEVRELNPGAPAWLMMVWRSRRWALATIPCYGSLARVSLPHTPRRSLTSLQPHGATCLSIGRPHRIGPGQKDRPPERLKTRLAGVSFCYTDAVRPPAPAPAPPQAPR